LAPSNVFFYWTSHVFQQALGTKFIADCLLLSLTFKTYKRPRLDFQVFDACPLLYLPCFFVLDTFSLPTGRLKSCVGGDLTAASFASCFTISRVHPFKHMRLFNCFSSIVGQSSRSPRPEGVFLVPSFLRRKPPIGRTPRASTFF